MFRSAYFKLTLWYLALVMGISLTFSFVLYHVATNELYNGLHRETQRIFTQFPIFDNSPMLKPDADDSYGAHRILIRIIIFNVVVLITAGIASYLLARRTLRPIEEAHEQQKRFTADVSHELRTPLTALRMESEVTLMNKSADTQELRHALESNLEEVTKLENLINNLLRLSRLEADEIQQLFNTVHISEILSAALSEIQKLASEKQVKIDADIHDIQVTGDADSLRQLAFILLDNAVKYSKKGQTVYITSHKKGDKAIFSIKDEGIGIPQDHLARVFDRFYRAENSRNKSDIGGFGLGLSIAKMIADVHNGDIIVSSEVGKGTTAKVVLSVASDIKPAADAAVQDQPGANN